MSYAQKLVSFGIDSFCAEAKTAGAKGLIIPDLPFDADEYTAVSKTVAKYGLEIVPVVSPGMEESRMGKCAANAGSLIYLTSIKGITGNKLKLNASLGKTAKRIKKLKPGARLAIGFGISSRKDVDEILQIADLAVVGSSVIRRINKTGVDGAVKFLAEL